MSSALREVLKVLNLVLTLAFAARNLVLIAHALRIALLVGSIPSIIELMRFGRVAVHLLLLML